MNYKIALGAAFMTAIGLTGCDSRDQSYVREGESTNVVSGATVPGTITTDTSVEKPTDASAASASGTQEMGDIANRKTTAPAPVPAQPVSGTTSDTDLDEDSDNADSASVYHNDDDLDQADEDVLDDDSVVSGSTSEPTHSHRESYRQTDLHGGMAQDRNLRYGLIGNGTGMGMEDTSSKFMTDNYTISDPKISNQALASSGALSAPTDDQDALKDIKSGTSFDPENYYIEEDMD